MNRRTAVKSLTIGGIALSSGLSVSSLIAGELPEPTPSKLPRWRGFNLLEKFIADWQKPYQESDFAEIAELGFNFVRLPLDYRCWAEPNDWTKFRESTLKEIDAAVEYGKKHGVHVQLNFHRAPGYTVANPPEKKDLWTDPEAQKVCAEHWTKFAERYHGRPSREVSFNLFNEPAKIKGESYRAVVEIMCNAIRAKDKDRLIVCDGREWGTVAPTELIGLNVAAATRGYAPFHLTHYRANWVPGSEKWAEPNYPFKEGNTTWDMTNLKRDQIGPWKALQAKGVGVMVGEFGCHNQTSHSAVLAWMTDCLAAWKEANWGWALWNYRGNFGPLDSDRKDVKYEDWKGHKLDRAMMDRLVAG